MEKKMLKNKYPDWVCHDCATKADGKIPEGHLSTFHIGECGVCGIEKSVTEPRDYRYPVFKEGSGKE
jgi:hypothetical protein